jgi:hypothetical protein
MHPMNIIKHRCKHWLSIKIIEFNYINYMVHSFWFLKKQIAIKTTYIVIAMDSKGHLHSFQINFRYFYLFNMTSF